MTSLPPHQTSNCNFVAKRQRHHRRGFTLVEILIALTMTLIVLFAMAQAFQFASGEIANGRAVLEMSNRLRNAQQLMRTDLAGLTVDVRPHTETSPTGYFEYVDGPSTDKAALLAGTGNGYLGDVDDILAFTTRNLDGSFRGRYGNTTLQSSFAEIIWFTEVIDSNQNDTIEFTDSAALYRRVLLIRPDLIDPNVGGLLATQDAAEVTAFFQNNDISARWIDSDGDGFRDLIVANSLEDLARRENRFARNSLVFPHFLDRATLAVTRISGDFTGDDILLTDIAAFDVQVYSPNSPVDLIDLDNNGLTETAVNPADIGFSVATSAPNGGFIDLASTLDLASNEFDRTDDPMILNMVPEYAFSRTRPHFWTLPTLRSQLATPFPSGGTDVAYCTWSPHYETDGIDQDRDSFVDGNGNVQLLDEGTNGLDDNPFENGVDDDGERETSPPYPFPVRGIQVTFRIIEKNTRQVRQTSVIQNFLPQ